MIHVDHSIRYDRPTGAIFAALTDIAGYPNWQPDVLSAEITGEAGLGPGTPVRQVRKVMGRRTEIELTVSAFRPDELLTLATVPDTHPAVSQTYRLRPDGEGCLLEFELTIDGVPRMAEHLARTQLSRQIPRMFQLLGEHLTTPARP
ncbi:SRPBCC family protein [Micromonospora chersina]